MKAGAYILHALKYFIRLLVLLAIIYLLLLLVGGAKVSAGQFVVELFKTTRGKLLLGALAVLAAVYPLFGFVRRTVKLNLGYEEDREMVLNAFHAAGYSLREERQDGSLVFRGSPMKKVVTVWDDKVTVTPGDNNIVLEGIRRETVQVEFRLNTYLHNRRDDV